MAGTRRNTESKDTALTSGQQKLVTNGTKSARPQYGVFVTYRNDTDIQPWSWHYTREEAEIMQERLSDLLAATHGEAHLIEVPNSDGVVKAERKPTAAKPARPAPTPHSEETPPQAAQINSETHEDEARRMPDQSSDGELIPREAGSEKYAGAFS